MKVITLNVNGIRSATQKGLLEWLILENPDIILLQEVRALEHQLPALIGLEAYQAFWFAAQKPGYSGVGILSKFKPNTVQYGFGSEEFDAEGRVLRVEFDGFSAISAYFPSGSSSAERQAAKYRFLAEFEPWIQQLKQDGEVLIGGDFNIAHMQIDLKNWRSNLESSGFLPDERAWMSRILATGFVDVFRTHVGQTEHFSWWSNRGRARQNNIGWRIDYQLCSTTLAARVKSARIYREQFYSDHAPVILEFDQLTPKP
jgi:exodeoxyribonuclease III